MTLLTIPDLSKIRRVLIIRLSSIGDVVHALPVAAALKNTYPHLELTWMVEEMSADIVIGNPNLHEVIVIPRSRWKAGRGSSFKIWKEYCQFLIGLRKHKFDMSLDLHGRAKSGLIAAAAGAPYRFGWKRLREGSQLISHSIGKEFPGQHRVQWFLNVVQALGVEASVVEFPIFIPQSARNEVHQLLEFHGVNEKERIAIVNPAVGDDRRRWSAESFAQLVLRMGDEFGLTSVLIGASKDIKLCERIRHRVQFLQQNTNTINRHQNLCVNVAGETNLKSLAALLDLSILQISGDTGSAHIGAAIAKPTIALFGPTDPDHAGPWSQERHTISRWPLCKSSCSNSKCSYAKDAQGVSSVVGNESSDGSREISSNAPTASCMLDISVDEVMESVRSVMKDQYA